MLEFNGNSGTHASSRVATMGKGLCLGQKVIAFDEMESHTSERIEDFGFGELVEVA